MKEWLNLGEVTTKKGAFLAIWSFESQFMVIETSRIQNVLFLSPQMTSHVCYFLVLKKYQKR